MSKQRCGTCKWWQGEEFRYKGVVVRECEAPLPPWVDASIGSDDCKLTTGVEGTDCPCWQARK